MGWIILEGLQFKSHIGVYEYEQQYGNNFEVDIRLQSNTVDSAGDDLKETIDYDAVYDKAAAVMRRRYGLIESACRDILSSLMESFPRIDFVHVRVTKLHPPLGGEVRKVSVEMERRRNGKDGNSP